MQTGIICAGFGGQGVLTAGKIIMYVAYKAEKKVTWFPSYGNEMRGGSANCNVVVSDEKIASPYVKYPDVLMALNNVSVDKYESLVKPGGYMFVNSSLMEPDRTYRDDIHVIQVPVTEIAQKVANAKGANICMLGVMIKETGLFDMQVFEDSMCEYFENQGKGKFNDGNRAVFQAGYNYQK